VAVEHDEDPIGGSTTPVHLESAWPVRFCAELRRGDPFTER
jgi:hypothetical protein